MLFVRPNHQRNTHIYQRKSFNFRTENPLLAVAVSTPGIKSGRRRHYMDLGDSIDVQFMKIDRVISEISPDRQTPKLYLYVYKLLVIIIQFIFAKYALTKIYTATVGSSHYYLLFHTLPVACPRISKREQN